MVMHEDDYRAESDHGAVQRAAEIMADKARMRGVLRHHAKMQKGKALMSAMLAKHKMAGKMGGGKDGY